MDRTQHRIKREGKKLENNKENRKYDQKGKEKAKHKENKIHNLKTET